MSGLGGGGNGGGGATGNQALSCEDIIIETQLSSPKDNVVAKLKVGDILFINLQLMGLTTVVTATFDGEIAGGLASPDINQLRECISQGYKYIASIISIRGGQVKVRVINSMEE